MHPDSLRADTRGPTIGVDDRISHTAWAAPGRPFGRSSGKPLGENLVTRKTHTAGAALAGAGVALAAGLSVFEAGVLVLGALATAMVPDWDRVLDSGPNHRSVTHSLIFAGGFVVALAAFSVATFGFAGGGSTIRGFLLEGSARSMLASLLGTFAVGGAVGYISHLLLDSLTGKRIWLLFPGGPRFGLPLFITGEFGETLFGLVISGLLVWAIYVLVMG